MSEASAPSPSGTTRAEDSAPSTTASRHALPSGTRSVELQNLCPFRAYAELRLGSSPLDAPEPGVPPDLRGMLLHAALEKLWGVLRHSAALQGQSAESLDALIAKCVDEAANETMGRAGEGTRSGAQRRECRRAGRLIRALCDLERRRAPFSVRETEFKRTLQLAGAQLNVRVDRLDELAGGGLAILDYKSGRPTPGDWYSERPSHPQLLAYLAAVGDEAVALATVSVTAREVKTGREASVQIRPSGGLSQREIVEIITRRRQETAQRASHGEDGGGVRVMPPGADEKP